MPRRASNHHWPDQKYYWPVERSVISNIDCRLRVVVQPSLNSTLEGKQQLIKWKNFLPKNRPKILVTTKKISMDLLQNQIEWPMWPNVLIVEKKSINMAYGCMKKLVKRNLKNSQHPQKHLKRVQSLLYRVIQDGLFLLNCLFQVQKLKSTNFIFK